MPLVSLRAPASGIWRVDVGSLDVGDTAADVRQATGGETSAAAAVTLRRRPLPPAMLVVRAPPTIHAWRKGPVVRGTGAAGGTVTVTANGSPAGAATVAVDGTWSIDLAALAPGWWRLVFVQTAGGVTYPAAIRTLAVDAPPSWVVPEATFDVDFRRQRAFVESALGEFVVLDRASFPTLLTFTRASTGTYFDADGTMRTAAADVPRYAFDPVSGAPLGLLCEGARTNLQVYSNDIAGGGWTRNNVGVSDNAGSSKDGSANADFVVEDSSTNEHSVTGSTHAVTSGVAYTTSAYAKSSDRSLQIVLSSPRFGSNAWANFDLQAGIVGTVGISAIARIEPVGGGWFRCHITSTATSSGNAATRFQIVQGAASARLESYAGNGVSGLFLTFLQTEAAAFASSYIATGAAAATRAADAPTMPVGGWLNPLAGTLICEWSQPVVDASISGRVVQIDDGDNNDYLAPLVVGATPRFNVAVGGATQAGINGGVATSGVVARAAAAYAENSFAFSMNGSAAGTDGAGSVPTGLTTLRFGNSATGGHPLFGHLRRVACRRDRVADASLPALAA